jgi:hypothetical protein
MMGWIKISRALKKWQWFQHAETLQLLIYLLLSAEFAPRKYFNIQLVPGQLVVSRKQLVHDLRSTDQRVRTMLKRLEDSGEITLKSTSEVTNKKTLVTLVNWAKYQGNNDDATSEITNHQPTINQPLTNPSLIYNNTRIQEGAHATKMQEIRKDLHESEMWQEQVLMMMHGNGYKDLKMVDVARYIDRFVEYVISAHDVNYEYYRVKQHFVNWLRAEVKRPVDKVNTDLDIKYKKW